MARRTGRSHGRNRGRTKRGKYGKHVPISSRNTTRRKRKKKTRKHNRKKRIRGKRNNKAQLRCTLL